MTVPGVTLPGRKRFDVVGVGLNAVDHLCTVPSFPGFNTKLQMTGYSCQPGGQVATAMVALQRWGCRTAYVGSFGDGIIGQLSRRSLGEEGIDLGGSIHRKGVGNQMAVILVDEGSGERTVLMHRPPALMLRPEELRRDIVLSGRVLHLDGYDLDAAVAAATWARAEHIPVVVDVDTRSGPVERLLAITDIVIVSQEFAASFTGAADPEVAIERLAGVDESAAGRDHARRRRRDRAYRRSGDPRRRLSGPLRRLDRRRRRLPRRLHLRSPPRLGARAHAPLRERRGGAQVHAGRRPLRHPEGRRRRSARRQGMITRARWRDGSCGIPRANR